MLHPVAAAGPAFAPGPPLRRRQDEAAESFAFLLAGFPPPIVAGFGTSGEPSRGAEPAAPPGSRDRDVSAPAPVPPAQPANVSPSLVAAVAETVQTYQPAPAAQKNSLPGSGSTTQT